MSLQEYRKKRDFKKTREPRAQKATAQGHIFVIQKHHASHLHYDFRLELDGVLKSWAVPKGPPEKAKDKRLAVEVEDHPVSYASFEGDIPEGEYGAGHVEIWDRGTWRTQGNAREQLKKGHLEFELQGERLSGRWMLVRTHMKAKKANWLLIKRSGGTEITETAPEKIVKMPTRKSALPRFVEPALCTLVDEAPTGDEWLHEAKFDGYRTECRLQKGKAHLLTRTGLDWTKKYREIAHDCSQLKATAALLDGEVCWVDDKGLTQFGGLQSALEEGRDNELVYYVFDILHLNGHDLQDLPLIERKKILEDLLKKSKCKRLIFSDHHRTSGAQFFASACRAGFEGIISKRAQSPYSSGRGQEWLKVKCTHNQEFVIGGYTLQKESEQIGSLLMGFYENKKLRYAGRVGTGFSKKNLPLLTKQLHKLKNLENPFSEKPPGAVIFVKPQLVAQIEFGSWTEDKILRHAAFKGLREDKAAKNVRAEESQTIKKTKTTRPLKKERAIQTAKKKSTKTTSPSMPSISHPEKILFRENKITKGDLAEYYQKIQKWILPHLKGRPLSLLRCPEGAQGTCFFQKHLDAKEPIIQANNQEELMQLIQLNTLELHAWNCHDIEKPDLIVFDLDPDPGVSWKKVQEAALDIRQMLDQLKLKSFLKVSGNKGLHIHVPILPLYSWDEVKGFAQSLCQQLTNDKPDLYTVNILKKKRKNKIFLDYLRNGYGATSVVPYSTRAKTNASVALPINWKDLAKLKAPNIFTLKEVPRILAKRTDPWKDYFKVKQKVIILESARKARRKR